jgi:DNA (cytosine-5)-methyltransferase 1
MNELALFAGVGGGLYGSLLCGWTTICAVELSEYCRETLLRRQQDGVFPVFPIWDDVRTFDGRGLRGHVDIVTGGDPCQENSAARSHGTVSVRSLGHEFLRVVGDVRPQFVLRENPARVRSDAPWPADRFASGLESMGYSTAIVEIRSCCLGADHQRARLFVLGRMADADGKRRNGGADKESASQEARVEHAAGSMARADHIANANVRAKREAVAGELRRGSDGLAHRRQRLVAIGNGQDPDVVQAAWAVLSGNVP